MIQKKMIVPYCLIRCYHNVQRSTPLFVTYYHPYHSIFSFWLNGHPQWNSYQKIHNIRSLSTSKEIDKPIGISSSSSFHKESSRDNDNNKDVTTTKVEDHHNLIRQFHRDLTSSIWNKKQSIAKRHEFETWWKQFEKLFQFYQIHGHCNVPSSNIDLLKFVHSQRKAFKGGRQQTQQSKKEYPHWKIQLLKSIGFQFDPLEEAWNDKFHELVQYVQENGNSLIPQHYHINPQLAKWVHEQRVQYHLLYSSMNHKSSFMTWERVDKLESIGFIWDVHEYQWEEHVEEFRQFVQQHGHGLVPQSYGKLGRWVNNVRQEYRKWIHPPPTTATQKNKETKSKSKVRMNRQRFLTLQEEGFIWDVHEYKWQEKCAAICAFRNLLGRWPTKKDDSTLAYWIKTQNDLYHKQQTSANNVILTPKRVQILEQIGLISLPSNHTNKTNTS